MVPKANLTDEQSANLAALSRRFPKTGRACQIVASLDDFYRSATPKDAESASRRVANTSSTHEESRFPTNFGVEPVYNKTII